MLVNFSNLSFYGYKGKGFKKHIDRMTQGRKSSDLAGYVDKLHKRAAIYSETKGKNQDYIRETVLRESLSKLKDYSIQDILAMCEK